jgi:hypothetical protein
MSWVSWVEPISESHSQKNISTTSRKTRKSKKHASQCRAMPMSMTSSLVALLVAISNVGGAFAADTTGGDGCPSDESLGLMGTAFGVVVWAIVLFYVFYAFHLVCDEYVGLPPKFRPARP